MGKAVVSRGSDGKDRSVTDGSKAVRSVRSDWKRNGSPYLTEYLLRDESIRRLLSSNRSKILAYIKGRGSYKVRDMFLRYLMMSYDVHLQQMKSDKKRYISIFQMLDYMEICGYKIDVSIVRIDEEGEE